MRGLEIKRDIGKEREREIEKRERERKSEIKSRVFSFQGCKV